ncbi:MULTISPECIES: hypothetical protein [Francisella]|nr:MULTISPECIES: hypothetical protein [Francisella]AVC44850.1 hypothetical protein B4919_08675 [Francisella tularensis subsp. novicida]
MKKIISIALITFSITTTGFSYSLHPINSFSSQSFPEPVLNLAS